MGFDRNTSVARDKLVLARDALRALELGLAIVPVARIQYDGILVSAQLSLDTAPGTTQCESYMRLVPVIVKCPIAIVPVAATPAMILKVGIARREAELMRRRPKVVNVILGHFSNDTSGKSILITGQDTLGAGHM